MTTENKIKCVLIDFKINKITLQEATKQILLLLNVVERSEQLKDLLEEFIDWARDCGEDVFYIFEETDEAINKFFEQRDE